jgi:hypothetical protein
LVKVTEPKAQALFETSAEVLTGLAEAFDDYEKKSEAAWRTVPTVSRPKETANHALKAINPATLTSRSARRDTSKPAMRKRGSV